MMITWIFVYQFTINTGFIPHCVDNWFCFLLLWYKTEKSRPPLWLWRKFSSFVLMSSRLGDNVLYILYPGWCFMLWLIYWNCTTIHHTTHKTSELILKYIWNSKKCRYIYCVLLNWVQSKERKQLTVSRQQLARVFN